MDPYIGKMLDNRYEILECIGAGGMAVVYKAKCHRLNRLVALKILKSDLAQDEEFRRRFNAESQAIALLSHPNIVSVYDVSTGGDVEYIVMELIDGITLKQYMERRGRLSWREALHFITQIMRGLSHAHSRGVIHRDIKPQNIMVLRDGSVRVADFGIAYLEDASQTMPQEALGSVHYISPEQARGDHIDARSDIYSAGVVLYEMLTGRLPFEGESAVSVAIQHLSSIPLSPREIDPEIPEQLELICMKAMAGELDARYLSADAMISDLEAFRKNPEIELDFDLSDLRMSASSEPTLPLRVEPDEADGHMYHTGRKERRREEQEEQERQEKGNLTGTTVKIAIGIVAVLVAFFLLRSILSSFQEPVVEQFSVPAVLGLSIEEAQSRDDIKDIFTIEEKGTVSSNEFPADTIARQSPVAGEHRKGDNLVIEVWLSSGADVGVMPDVTNLTPAQVRVSMKSLIAKYDLTIEAPEETQRFSDEITAGCVINSIPAEGAELKKGDTIELILSKGPELLEFSMPPFVGQNIDEVRAQLNNFKLVCSDANIEMVDSSEPMGQILEQTPTAYSSVKEWDTVQFKISSGLTESEMLESYDLPQDGRETVLVEVYVGDEKTPQYQETLKCSDGYARVTLHGMGTQTIKVYYDGVLDQSQTHPLQFN